jgi:release factor glutamine methyltransferase
MAVNIQTIKDIRTYLAEELKDIYPKSETDALSRIVIETVTGITRPGQFYRMQQEVTSAATEKILEICKELKTGKPLQYILGETTFYNCRIKLNNETLIPRPETEELADLVIKENKDFTGTVLDLGTGSGCIAVALAANLPFADVQGVDISEKALTAAKENAIINNVKVRFVKDDILNPVSRFPAGIIVSNPPYIRESEKLFMNKNVVDFEPHSALFVPDDDPLKYYRAIIKAAEDILMPGGKIYFEINETLGDPIYKLLESFRYTGIKIIQDINGRDRIVKGKKNG